MKMEFTALDLAFATVLGILASLFIKFYSSWPAPRKAGTLLLETLQKFRNSNSDHLRQGLAKNAANQSFHFAALLTIPIVYTLLLYYLPYYYVGIDISSLPFLVFTTVVGIFAWYFFKFFPTNSNTATKSYSTLSRLLHHVALDSTLIRKSTFKFSRQHFLSSLRAENEGADSERDVLIMGMARSGTSLMLRLISEDRSFSVLRYKDMPFVLAPAFWRQFSKPYQQELAEVERFHMDGLLNNSDSPEAFEEVFWETFRTDKNLDDRFSNRPSEESLNLFRSYKNIIRSLGDKTNARYLSKNNNSLVRMDKLAADNQNILLILYREPLAAAASMRQTHLRFCALFNNDRFGRVYLNWLAHFEFGPNHKPFSFAKPSMSPNYSSAELDYWLEYWCVVHRHILDNAPKNCLLISYDQLCTEPVHFIASLSKRLNGAFSADDIKIVPKKDSIQTDALKTDLLNRSKSIYEQLLADTRNLTMPLNNRTS